MIFIDFQIFFKKFEFLTIFWIFFGQIWGKISDFGHFSYPILGKKSIEIRNIALRWPKILMGNPCVVLRNVVLEIFDILIFLPKKIGSKFNFGHF
jgi:hypothetical protein